MRLVVSEKNIAAKRIAEILAVGKPKTDKVYSTPVYRFRRDGEDWVSIGLKGHILKVDFPEELAKWDLKTLPELIRADILKVPSEKGIIQSLKNLAKKAEEIVIATDFDREGELIGSDARAMVREVNAEVPILRARFSAITKGEIERAFSELGTISDHLAEAGEARQDIDLMWGAWVTRYLTLAMQQATKRKWGSVLSAGRVQTPTLKLIVDREKERDAFVPETYWVVRGRCSKAGDEFAVGHATERFSEEAAARSAMASVEGAREARVTGVKRTRRVVKPPAPFNTTALQAAAASEGMSPSRTMRVAESLYMSGLMSYPRVDNTVYPESLDLREVLRAIDGVPQYHEYASALLAKGQLTATRGSKEATDHPPIHPTGAADPEKLKPEEWKLYNMVARRFMATLSDDAIVEGTRVDLDVAGEPFFARGDVTVQRGFRAIYPYGVKKEEHLPALAEGERVDFLGAEMEEKQTQPPARYGQGKLIQEMEKLGLGTKATRHAIIQNLYDRKYAVNDPIEPTCQGISVMTALLAYAEHITTPEMTRELESEMDAIAKGEAGGGEVVDHSRTILDGVSAVLLPKAAEVGELLREAADEDATLGTCPTSGHDLRIKYSPKTRGYFVGCMGYPDCQVTFPLPQGRYEAVAEACPVCGTPQVKVFQFRQRPLVICLSPECATRKEPELVLGKCPTGDGGDLIVRRSPKTLKRFVRCTNYDECKTSYPLPQSGEIEATGETCGEGACGAPIVVVTTRRGPWRICVNPECPSRPPSTAGAKGAKRAGGAAAKGRASGTKRTGAKSARSK